MRCFKVFVFVLLFFFSSGVLYAGDDYTGLTNDEIQILKDAGYSDSDISQYNQESIKFGNLTNSDEMLEFEFSSKSDEMDNLLLEKNGGSSARKHVSDYQQQKVDEGTKKVEKLKEEIEDLENEKKFYETISAPWRALVNFIAGNKKNSFPTILNAFWGLENGCWFCGIYENLFTTMNNLAKKTNTGLKSIIIGGNGVNPLFSLMGVLLFGYIIWVVGKTFFSFTEPKELISQIFFPFVRCMIAALLISNWQAIYTYAVDPLLAASIGFGKKIIDASGEVADYSASSSFANGANISSKCSLTYNPTVYGTPSLHVNWSDKGYSSATFYEVAASNDGISKGVNGSIQCFLYTVSRNLILWMAIGATFLADCWQYALENFPGAFQMLVVGIIIFVGAFMIFLAFPLKLLDSMFRLMFLTALMPLWIAFWVIPQTRGYTKKAWGLLENVMVTFIILSVILVMVLSIFEKLFDKDVSGIDVTTLSNLLLADNVSQAMKEINFSGLGIFMSAALMYLAFSLIGKTDSFVGQFASGGGSVGIGSDFGSRAFALGQKTIGAGAALGGAAWRVLTKKKDKEPGNNSAGGSTGSSAAGSQGTHAAPNRNFVNPNSEGGNSGGSTSNASNSGNTN